MKIETASGIILRTRLLTETSLIVHWLTPELGRVATVAKGARRPKSPFAGKLDLFYAAEFSFSRSRHSDLHNLREVKLHETHGAIRTDIVKLQQAAYAASCVELATETETPLPEVFALGKIDRCDLLKVDIEGAEYGLFEKITPELWSKISRVVMEVHKDATHSGREIVEILERNGFQVHLRDPDSATPLLWAARAAR